MNFRKFAALCQSDALCAVKEYLDLNGAAFGATRRLSTESAECRLSPRLLTQKD